MGDPSVCRLRFGARRCGANRRKRRRIVQSFFAAGNAILHRVRRHVRRRLVRQRLQELDEIVDLVLGQMARLAVLVALVRRRHDVEQRRRLAVVQIGRGAIDAEQRRRVVLGAHAFGLVVVAGADVVQLERLLQAAVGVVRPAVAGRAADVLAEEDLLAALPPASACPARRCAATAGNRASCSRSPWRRGPSSGPRFSLPARPCGSRPSASSVP